MTSDAATFLAQAQKELAGKSPQEVLRWASSIFKDKVAFATSLGLEDQVLTDMIASEGLPIRLFTLDTGRLFPETYELLEETARRYGVKIHVVFPDTEELTAMVEQHGVNLFRKSVALRKLCCRVRKVHPLQRELKGLRAWIAGLRSGQAETRREVPEIQWDEANGLFKISPLARWSHNQVWEYVRERDVAYNLLHDKGFPSIGCACCTRAVQPGEDVRAGRWWWEAPEQKECGLHAHRRESPRR